MYKLDNISLAQFRNYGQASFTFSENVTGFCGKNGSGKTNLLDAIYYMCFTKSYFGKTDIHNTQQGKSGFRLSAQVTVKDKSHNITCVLRENGKKEFGVDNENYTRFAAHIGKFPCVMIAPDDVAIITQASEERRKFIDYTISQLDAAYLQTLIDYNKLLQQRNSLLKQLAERNNADESLMEVISDQLVHAGNFIYRSRRAFLETFIPVVLKLYDSIAEHEEKLTITYKSHLGSDDFKKLLTKNKNKDIALQRTSQGVHRDDLELNLESYPFKTTASQGQRKSLLFALKLAEFEVLLKHTGFPPLLLLDDVFEKLDETRMKNLLIKVCVENKGQVFITDTHCSRLKEALEQLRVSHEIKSL
ncbi:DNA replication and repair protein RecF [Agriterribacter sp.]|uniref:DNA replication/repair protein RecF n=1 Tax=Agriterribacter sp. TaxID=2821509 RepID=UPI002CD51094|nr:DNA replication and repair protein RecF [Agriterribacter sp.]HRP58527.1 DNA replication and repair protein RecF [Agriterribacter sp.]